MKIKLGPMLNYEVKSFLRNVALLFARRRKSGLPLMCIGSFYTEDIITGLCLHGVKGDVFISSGS